jgi:hypothetical protein
MIQSTGRCRYTGGATTITTATCDWEQSTATTVRGFRVLADAFVGTIILFSIESFSIRPGVLDVPKHVDIYLL